MRLSFLAFLLSSSVAVHAHPEHVTHFPDELCIATCAGTGSAEVCTFTFEIKQGASELGYYAVEGCKGVMPVLGMRKDVQYRFVQSDLSNYYHPLGFAYFADGAHDDVDELEPGIDQANTGCADTNTCPAPMYIGDGNYLGAYSNIAEISPLNGDEDFGLDVYEPQFFANPVDWSGAGDYEVALKFDSTYEKDIFYFCHIHQGMTGRIKFIDASGSVITTANEPEIPYPYEMASAYDQSCGTYGVGAFQLPNAQCPSKFVCDAPEGVKDFAGCVDSMNCAMTAGMTTGATSDNAMALFVHQMVPHHQNAVNMAKALLKDGILDSCTDIAEETPACTLKVISMEIITQQNHQIQGMYGAVEELEYETTDDCVVGVSETHLFNIKNKVTGLCVDGASSQSNRGVVLKVCDGSLSQVWRADHNGRIRSKATGRCVNKQGTKVVSTSCAGVTENEVTRGFSDTIVFGTSGVMTPGAEANGETSLSVAARAREFNDIDLGADMQDFEFVYGVTSPPLAPVTDPTSAPVTDPNPEPPKMDDD